MAEAEPDTRTLVARCDCGFEARGTADQVVEGMSRHAREVHNMEAPRDAILARAKPV